jgi:hypothetical protein
LLLFEFLSHSEESEILWVILSLFFSLNGGPKFMIVNEKNCCTYSSSSGQ